MSVLKNIGNQNLIDAETLNSKTETVMLWSLLPNIRETVVSRMTATGSTRDSVEQVFNSIESDLSAYMKKRNRNKLVAEGLSLAICVAVGFHPIFRGLRLMTLLLTEVVVCSAITAVPRSLFLIQSHKRAKFLSKFFTPLTNNANIDPVDYETLRQEFRQAKWRRLLF